MPDHAVIISIMGCARALAAALVLMSSACARMDPQRPPIREQKASRTGAVTARFLGTTSILFHDQDTAILSDGFVTRPDLGRVLFGRIEPSDELIDALIARAGVPLAAVFTGHSHYDHALDAPRVARRTGAMLVGSLSTQRLGDAEGLPFHQTRVVRDRDVVRFRNFELTFIESRHSLPHLFDGEIHEPFVLPARSSRWKSGPTYSVLIRHPRGAVLVHGSAHFKPGALQGLHADVVYLGIGSLRTNKAFVKRYWDEVVTATGARRVVLVHWDDFTRPLSQPLAPAIDGAFRRRLRLIENVAGPNVDVQLPLALEPTDIFAGLAMKGGA